MPALSMKAELAKNQYVSTRNFLRENYLSRQIDSAPVVCQHRKPVRTERFHRYSLSAVPRLILSPSFCCKRQKVSDEITVMIDSVANP